MLFSRRDIWAVANIICWGTHVEASSHRRRRDEAPPPKRDIGYFTTDWILPPNDQWPLSTNQVVNYTVTGPVATPNGESLSMLLLWTNAPNGVPTTDNTWAVFQNKCK